MQYELADKLRHMSVAQRRDFIRSQATSWPLATVCSLPEPMKTEAKRALTGHNGWAWPSPNKMFYLRPAGKPIRLPRKESIAFDSLPGYEQEGREVSNRLFDRPIACDAAMALLLKDLYGDAVEEVDAKTFAAGQVQAVEESEPETEPKKPEGQAKGKK